MSRRAARQGLVDYLVQHGPVEDPSGRATAKFRAAVGYDGSDAAFSQLMAAMVQAGEITREVKGRRTYRIAATQSVPSTTTGRDQSAPTNERESQAELDYDELAAALLVQVVQTLTKGTQSKDSDGSWARRRMARLERRVDDLERELAQARAESKTLGAERDQLRLQLEHSESNLAVLTERMGSNSPRGTKLAKALGSDERALLHQLQGGSSKRQPDRAS